MLLLKAMKFRRDLINCVWVSYPYIRTYIARAEKKQLRKLSRAHWAFKNPRNKVEITTPISK